MAKDDLKEPVRPPRVPFASLSPSAKVVFIFKVTICILTFGFAFPNVGD